MALRVKRFGMIAVVLAAASAAPLADAQPDAGAAQPRPPTEGEGEGEPDHAQPPPREKPEPAPKPTGFVRGPVVLEGGMIRIPGGRFTMGTTERAAPPNEPPA